MISESQIQELQGADVYGSDGEKIGRAGQVYLDDQTGRPEWVTVRTGLFGTNESFVPLAQADLGDNGLTVPFTKDAVKDAPNVEPDDQRLSQVQERALYEHYDMDYSEQGSDTGLPAGAVGRDTSGSATDDAMARSEERLKVGKRTEETGRARLRKYVVTEDQSVNVPVTREEVRVEREPITDANRDEALEGPDISEGEHEAVAL